MPMKQVVLFLSFWIAFTGVSTAQSPGNPRGILFQFAVFEALLSGNFDGRMAISELQQHGDFGIGAFDRLDGELILLDGKLYQAKSDGKVYQPSSTAKTPYAFACRFSGGNSRDLPKGTTLESLQATLDQAASNAHLFYAFRVRGFFLKAKTRTVPGQNKPYTTLLDAVKGQVIAEFDRLPGTLVGFRCPAYIQGINYPGYHFHFISDDRQKGGHLFACEMDGGQVQILPLPRYELALPEDPAAFQNVQYGKDRLEEMRRIVSGNK